MSENKIDRRDMCKSLLALGGIALTGAASNAQEATPTPTPIIDLILQDQRIADAVKRGATMEEIAKLREPIASTPAEAIRALKTGKFEILQRFGASSRTLSRRTPLANSGANAVRRRFKLLGQPRADRDCFRPRVGNSVYHARCGKRH